MTTLEDENLFIDINYKKKNMINLSSKYHLYCGEIFFTSFQPKISTDRYINIHIGTHIRQKYVNIDLFDIIPTDNEYFFNIVKEI